MIKLVFIIDAQTVNVNSPEIQGVIQFFKQMEPLLIPAQDMEMLDTEVRKQIAKNNVVVVFAKGETLASLRKEKFAEWSKVSNFPIFIAHPAEWVEVIEDVVDLLATLVEEGKLEVSADIFDKSVNIDEVLTELEDSTDVIDINLDKATKQRIRQMAKKKKILPGLLSFLRKRKGHYIWGGYNTNLTFTYNFYSALGDTRRGGAIEKNYIDLKKELLEKGIEWAWIGPLTGQDQWVVLVPDKDDKVISYISGGDVFPIHAYYLYLWEPDVPTTVVIVDQNYAVGITKWHDTIIEFQFSALDSNISGSHLKTTLVNLLGSMNTSDIVRIVVPYSEDDPMTASNSKALYDTLQGVVKQIKIVQPILELVDESSLPVSPHELPAFVNLRKISSWDMMYDPMYLDTVKRIFKYVITSLLIMGLVLTYTNMLKYKGTDLEKQYQIALYNAKQLQTAKEKVENLKKFNLIIGSGNNIAKYVELLTDTFGDHIAKINIDWKNKKVHATIKVDNTMTEDDIKRLLFTTNLASNVYDNTYVNHGYKTIRWDIPNDWYRLNGGDNK